jgi:hypothetical protein
MPPILIFLCLFCPPRQPKPADTLHLGVAALNQFIVRAATKHDTTSYPCYVHGYYVSGRHPMLVSDPTLLHRSTPVPDSLLAFLRGNGVDSIEKSRLARVVDGKNMQVLITIKLPPYFPPGENALRLEHYVKTMPMRIKP